MPSNAELLRGTSATSSPRPTTRSPNSYEMQIMEFELNSANSNYVNSEVAIEAPASLAYRSCIGNRGKDSLPQSIGLPVLARDFRTLLWISLIDGKTSTRD